MTRIKTEIGPIDGTPLKRMFWSIISDYDLKTGIAELVDNAIDLWTLGGRKDELLVELTLDAEQQVITVQDNAGGVAFDDLKMLVAPGGSRNDPLQETIGIFGVGGKRAGVALGEQVEIRTRYKSQQSYQIDINKDWLGIEDWDLPVYKIPNIDPGSTRVEISRLRKPFLYGDIGIIVAEFGEIYASFLQQGCRILLNEIPLKPEVFDHWAYPPEHRPRAADFEVRLGSESVNVAITAGLIVDRDPEEENYGVYIYCNDRLIVKELRSRDVGYFVTSEAGVPHPDASLCRAIVRIKGPAKLMPWNSSKSNINTGHSVFKELRPALIQMVSHFSSLSRRLKHEWDRSVTRFREGKVETVSVAPLKVGKRLNLPELPRVNKQQVERLKSANRKLLKNSPWTVGLTEAIAAVDVIRRQRFDSRNRIALILLDSDFEIGLKEFIVHRHDLFPPGQYNDAKIAQLFKNRTDLIREVISKQPIPTNLTAKAQHYYLLRNKLIHERASVDVSDTDIDNYKETVQNVLSILFKLRFLS